jgi:nucleotide-binding universal stress UspA family protein
MAGMTDGILVGYDGSPSSDLALRWAAREASDRGVMLTICHAWAPEDLALLTEPALFEQARDRGAEILDQGLRNIEPIMGANGAEKLLVGGSPARVLCERSQGAGMTVVGSRGHGRLAGVLLGSVAWQVAGHGFGRIVIVRGTGRPANRDPGLVVVGVDGSAASRAALEFAAEEAALRYVPLMAICALADAPGSLGGARQMEEEFSSLMTDWEKEHPDLTVLRHVAGGSPRTALLEAAAEAQMLVVGSRGRGGIHGMTIGSVTSGLLHHAPCTVGIVRQSPAE